MPLPRPHPRRGARSRARCSWSTTTTPTPRSPPLRKYAERDPRVVPDPQHLRRRARPGRSGTASTTCARRWSSSPWPTAATTPSRSTSSASSSSAGVVVAAASRYMSGGQQIGGPVVEEPAVAAGRAVAVLVRPRRHPRRHQLVQGVLGRASCATSTSTPTPASRSASSWWPRPAASAARSPRSPRSGSNAARARRTSRSLSGCPAYLKWYRFAFGPELSLDAVRAAKGTASVTDALSPTSAGARQRIVRVHRRLRRRGAARPRLHGGRRRQPLEVRPGARSRTTTTRATRWSKATRATSSCMTELLTRLRPLHRRRRA